MRRMRTRRGMRAGPGRGRRMPSPLLLAALLVVPLLLVAILSVAVGQPSWDGMWRPLGSPEAMREYVSGLGGWAPVAFFVAQAAQVILAPIPGGVTTVVGPLLFGPWLGTALILAGGVTGSVVLFALVRRWGRPLAVKVVGRGNLGRFSGAFEDEKGVLLFLVMLVPFVPDDVAVAVAGLSGVSLRRFLVLVALGRLPGWALAAFVAADLVGRSAGTLATVGLAAAVAAALFLVYRGRVESWLLQSAGIGAEEARVPRRRPASQPDGGPRLP